ncbi:ribonuclease H-like domain-containing protein [candidate division KSB1 bacterium]|nr:ribonuclease H-like domain-containing protein [candidate division KSB1 bacterium]
MNLKEKLASLDRYSTSATIEPPTITHPTIDTQLNGEEIYTKFGSCWRIQYRFDFSFHHGNYRMGDLLSHEPAPLKFIAKAHGYENINLKNLLFVDTETTGLSGGVGTVAFLLGTGYFQDNTFIIDQFFMRDFSEEASILFAFQNQLNRAIEGCGAVVSFNGKSYDLPLIFNRMIFNRFAKPVNRFKHIDILHAARRIWKRSLIDCSLTNVEANILKVHRVDDIPGYLIPEMYFQYLRNNDPANLNQVFLHNKLDILTLVGLLDEMVQLYCGNREITEEQVDWLTMCKAFDELQAYDEGLAFYTRLADLELPKKMRTETLLRIAAIHKKCNRFEEAMSYWYEAIKQDGLCLAAFEELAKAYEHQASDFPQARELTRRALLSIEVIDKFRPNGFVKEYKDKFLHRLQRLDKRIGREQD